MLVECLRARAHLAEIGLGAEVIDPIWLAPLDIETIAASVAKTGRLVVVDNGWTTCGASAEIALRVVERLQGAREIRVRRMGFAPTTCPPTPGLEKLFYPDARGIAAAARRSRRRPRHRLAAGREAGRRGDRVPGAVLMSWPLMRNNITRADLDAVIRFLAADDPILTQSKQVELFEQEWSEWLGVRHSVFVNSGACANLITMAALRHRFGPGEVIVPTLTWVSDIAVGAATRLHAGLRGHRPAHARHGRRAGDREARSAHARGLPDPRARLQRPRRRVCSTSCASAAFR